jgi:glycosyltransferase involved in cell wall biosynthesis
MIDYKNPDYSESPGSKEPLRTYVKDRSHSACVDVSIITPYFNAGDCFLETVHSVQAQSLQNWEWVVVDDGSDDQRSLRLLSDVVSEDPRIKVIRQANAGPSSGRNTSFRNTSGRYVCLLDSDDLLEPTYLEKCVWFLESNPEFAFCNTYSVVFGAAEYLWTTGFERGDKLLQANSGPPISVIRRAAYEACGGFDESIRFGHEDWDFWLAMAKAGFWGYTIAEFLQWYRKRNDGRFEQNVRIGITEDVFRQKMREKYDGLRAIFPSPKRSHPAPYETIETHSFVSNCLAKNPSGRRILYIVPWMVTGGADRVNLDLIEGLTARGHEVTVCATLSADHNWEHQFSCFTPDIFVLPNILRASDYPRFLAYLVRSRKIDTVLVTHSTIGYQLLPYLRAVSPDVAFLDMCHVEETQWLNGGHPRFGIGYQDVLDLNIVTSLHLAEWMENRGAEGERIRVLYTGVRTSKTEQPEKVRSAVRSELNIPEDMPVIVFAGRICEQKRPVLLADILKVARDQGLRFRAIIIGEGELKGQLENLQDKYQLTDRVRILAAVSHQRWLDILVASDIFLMPSQYEGISIALLEALIAGVVPVVAQVGGHKEIITPKAGVLIAQGDNEIQDYADAIRRLLTYPEELRQMSMECKAMGSSKLSWDNMIANFLALLDEAHRLKISHPRHSIGPGLGLELASLALECKRLSDAVDWLWNANPNPIVPNASPSAVSRSAQALSEYAIRLSQTKFGRMALCNKTVKSTAKGILKILAAFRAS